MKGFILEKQKMYYTHMDVIFESMDNMEVEYNWLITDYECNHYIEPFIFEKRHGYIWITGKELSKFLKENKIQFIWGAFTAFDKNIEAEKALAYCLPKSNKSFFENKILKMQHPLSIMEIIAVDSTLVFAVSLKDENIDQFLTRVPLAEDLHTYILNQD